MNKKSCTLNRNRVKVILMLAVLLFAWPMPFACADAQDPFVGEICLVPWNFAPTGWAKCEGQLIPISQNTALFSLLGTYYGGDGKSTFALPDLQGRAPVSWGPGSGLSEVVLGEAVGAPEVLPNTSVANHDHGGVPADAAVPASTSAAAFAVPGPSKYIGVPVSASGEDIDIYTADNVGSSTLYTSDNISAAAVSNLQPSIPMTYIIALQGVYPQRP